MQVKLIKLLVALVTVWALIYPFLQEPEPQFTPVENDEEEIEIVKVVPEKPLHSVKLPNFSAIKDIQAKKKAFFDFIKPHVEAENKLILEQRATLDIALMMLQFGETLTRKQVEKVAVIFSKYDLKNEKINEASLKKALRRVDIIPKELALMQAANESAWGTSRFARIGLNFFGQWCYTKGCGMIPKRRADEAEHEVRAFKSVRAAVKSYFRNINTHEAYKELRGVRAGLRAEKVPIEATALTAGLLSYSERGEDYVSELNDMIRHNRAYFDEE
ncbi:glucosaminidase domain-containing protein [Pseudoalteromonas sp. McH1-7]|uniref:glucosaminidase domain-containing protein n=1 Tax=Pseudoalteromonas TaxID=53246 RepID=UPI001590F682|nr:MULTISPECIES: glucosaminidase domain-containing protein [Pseudoalteromonas]MDW7549984.1 glucosaminidase domain-containing protein [Pseudoalteromonas peptidolytica]NUZ09523.1 glucosaminidase domain-containing protein [Pseudoalteromonas sp. McH1-7]USD29684.1 glucosaminidase domain-containing protein [Pseudoalteromonas sp. SCSIO 43201]